MWYNTAMGNFGRDDRGGFGRGGGRGGFSSRGRSTFGRGGGFDRGGDRGDRPMFKTTCSNCGKDCEVPFRPTNGKPVYCSECFEKMGNGDRRDAPRNDFRSPSPISNQSSVQIDAINAKLDRILGLLEPKKIEEIKEVEAPKIKKAVKKATVKK
jgi:CxxC-x17-CxxC domain-containing protein